MFYQTPLTIADFVSQFITYTYDSLIRYLFGSNNVVLDDNDSNKEDLARILFHFCLLIRCNVG